MYNVAIRRKYGPYRGTYTNIAKTAIASLYFQCYNPNSYSGHPRGSNKYRLAKMWGGGVYEGHIWPTAYFLIVRYLSIKWSGSIAFCLANNMNLVFDALAASWFALNLSLSS